MAVSALSPSKKGKSQGIFFYKLRLNILAIVSRFIDYMSISAPHTPALQLSRSLIKLKKKTKKSLFD